MPLWPFGKRSRAKEAPLPPELEQLTDATGQRFVVSLADPAQLEGAIAVLNGRLGAELDVVPADGGSLEIASSFDAGSAAVLRPLNILRNAGILARDLELLDLVTDVDDRALRRLVEAWGQYANQGPHRLRLVRLAGLDTLERCLDGLRASPESGNGRRSAWSFAATCVALNTPGAEGVVLVEAGKTREPRVAESLVGAAEGRLRLAMLGGLETNVPPEAVAELLRRPGYLGERACQVAALLPAPLSGPVTDALLATAGGSGEAAVEALGTLRQAEPTSAVRSALEAALATGDPNARAAALETLAHHWGIEARPTWRGFLASKSAPMRWAAEAVIGLYGDEDDLVDAAAHLAKLARARPAISMSPPRGNEIVDLLVRHRERPAARAALDDLSARWDRLPEDLRSWLSEHHPWLDPARRVDRPAESMASAEEELSWPPPTISRRDGALYLDFDEVSAHHPVRERFEELAAAHPGVEVLDGDREWLSMRVTVPNAEALLHELWEAASSAR
jgi:hypothetical protein